MDNLARLRLPNAAQACLAPRQRTVAQDTTARRRQSESVAIRRESCRFDEELHRDGLENLFKTVHVQFYRKREPGSI